MIVKEILNQMDDGDDKDNALWAWKWTKMAVLGVVGAIGLYGSAYTIPNDSVGVIQRFGHYVRTTEPGIHMKWPYWIEEVKKVPTKRIQKEEFGFRSLRPGVDSLYIGK